jgi:hypothetical protein
MTFIADEHLIPTAADVPSLTLELVERGFSDEDILKLLGGNVRTLYERVWDPTRGYSGGPARFTLCGNTSAQPACVAARARNGQGDLRHRAISCQYAPNSNPVGLQLTYANNQWQYWNLARTLSPCQDGTTLVASFGDGPGNGNFSVAGSASCGAACQQANANGGGGTANARALNCGNPSASGVVGLQLAYQSGAWRYYNVASQLVARSASSTLVADWDTGGASNARVVLCDDRNLHPACAAAATNGGIGTSEAKALNCYNSAPSAGGHGVVGLQVAYVGGRWIYYALDGSQRPCVHGSVMVATTL